MVTVCSPRVRWRWWARQEHMTSMVMVYSNTRTLSHNYMVSTLSYALPLTLMHPCCGSGFLGSQALFSTVAMLIILCICILTMYFLHHVFFVSDLKRCFPILSWAQGMCECHYLRPRPVPCEVGCWGTFPIQALPPTQQGAGCLTAHATGTVCRWCHSPPLCSWEYGTTFLSI